MLSHDLTIKSPNLTNFGTYEIIEERNIDFQLGTLFQGNITLY
jgi:hypothetical protein